MLYRQHFSSRRKQFRPLLNTVSPNAPMRYPGMGVKCFDKMNDDEDTNISVGFGRVDLHTVQRQNESRHSTCFGFSLTLAGTDCGLQEGIQDRWSALLAWVAWAGSGFGRAE